MTLTTDQVIKVIKALKKVKKYLHDPYGELGSLESCMNLDEALAILTPSESLGIVPKLETIKEPTNDTEF